MNSSPCRNEKADRFLSLRFRHPQLECAHGAIERCHATRGRNARCALITGDTGLGKTQAIESYMAAYPAINHSDRTQHRILYVSLKQRTTTKEIILKLFRSMGIQRRSGTEGQLFDDILDILKACGVELIIIDEIQHVLPEHSHRRLQETRDFFKSLLDQSQVPIVFVGLPKAVGLLESTGDIHAQSKSRTKKNGLSFLIGDEGDQLKDRTMAGFEMRPYEMNSNAWGKVLARYQKAMGAPCISLSSPEISDRCWLASNGRLRRMSNLLAEAIEITEGEKQITKKMLADAYSRTEPLTVVDGENPFLISTAKLNKIIGMISEGEQS